MGTSSVLASYDLVATPKMRRNSLHRPRGHCVQRRRPSAIVARGSGHSMMLRRASGVGRAPPHGIHDADVESPFRYGRGRRCRRIRRDSLTAPPSLATAASVVALGFLGSRLLGLVRTVVIAHQFGTSPNLDAYFVAFRLPDLIFQLLAGATLGSAFIPTFARIVRGSGRARGAGAWRPAC